MALTLLALTVALTAIVWAPYWAGMQTVSSLATESSRGLGGPIASVIAIIARLVGLPLDTALTVALGGSLLALLTVLGWGLQHMLFIWRQGDASRSTDELSAWAYALMLVPVALPRAHPWFLLPTMALFAVSQRHTPRGSAIIYALAELWFLARVATW